MDNQFLKRSLTLENGSVLEIVSGAIEPVGVQPTLFQPASIAMIARALEWAVQMTNAAFSTGVPIGIPFGKFTLGVLHAISDKDVFGTWGDYPSANMCMTPSHPRGEDGFYHADTHFVFAHVRWPAHAPKYLMKTNEEWCKCVRQVLAANFQAALRRAGL